MKRNPNEVHTTKSRRKIEMFCHKCGTQIAEGSAFCQKCGTKVVYEEDAAQPAEQAVVSVAPVAAAPMRSTNTMTNQDIVATVEKEQRIW